MTPVGGLLVENLHFGYGSLPVLRGLGFSVLPGEVLGLVGPNGAGKTTTMDVLTGLLVPDTGTVRLAGRDVTRVPPQERARRGLARTYQHVNPIRRLSVVENVMIGVLYGRRRSRSVATSRRHAMTALERVGLVDRAEVDASSVSTGQRKLMDLARALVMEPDVLLMDEPLAALSSTNRQLTLSIVDELRAAGCAIVLIEHVMRAVLDTADRLVVVTGGAVLAEGTPRAVVQDPRVIDAYVGPGFVGSGEGQEARA